MSRLRLTALSAVHLALPRGVSARTTLFRVVEDHAQRVAGTGGEAADAVAHGDAVPAALASRRPLPRGEDHQLRSEEHTSELQSPYDIVCRLLLEKKKDTRQHKPPHAI